MTLHIVRRGVLASVLALSACGGVPPAPGPLPQAGPAAPPAPAPPPPPVTHPYAGTYTLTIAIGSTCTTVPESERTRIYSARFDPVSEGSYVITLSDASFLTGRICDGGSGRFAGVGCHQFFGYDDGVRMQFVLANNNDDAHGGHIVEQTASGSWLEIIGEAVGTRDPASMEAAGHGNVWRCPDARGYPFPCTSFVFCNPAELRLKLTRR